MLCRYFCTFSVGSRTAIQENYYLRRSSLTLAHKCLKMSQLQGCFSANRRRASSYSFSILFRFSCSSESLGVLVTLLFFLCFDSARRKASIPANARPPLEKGLSHFTHFTLWGSPIALFRGTPCLQTSSGSSLMSLSAAEIKYVKIIIAKTALCCTRWFLRVCEWNRILKRDHSLRHFRNKKESGSSQLTQRLLGIN